MKLIVPCGLTIGQDDSHLGDVVDDGEEDEEVENQSTHRQRIEHGEFREKGQRHVLDEGTPCLGDVCGFILHQPDDLFSLGLAEVGQVRVQVGILKQQPLHELQKCFLAACFIHSIYYIKLSFISQEPFSILNILNCKHVWRHGTRDGYRYGHRERCWHG